VSVSFVVVILFVASVVQAGEKPKTSLIVDDAHPNKKASPKRDLLEPSENEDRGTYSNGALMSEINRAARVVHAEGSATSPRIDKQKSPETSFSAPSGQFEHYRVKMSALPRVSVQKSLAYAAAFYNLNMSKGKESSDS
jgi:hypothetical protein